MMRLLRVELSRFFSRRVTQVASLGLLAVIVIALVGTWQSSAPATEAEKAQAQQYYEQALADWEVHGEEALADCYEMEAADQEVDPTVSYDCPSWEPQLENYLWSDTLFTDQAVSSLVVIGFAVLFYAFFTGVSFVAAEFATGSIGNWLTFEPRRTRVFTSKLLAAGIGVVLPAVLAALLMVGGTWALFASWGTLGNPTGELWRTVALVGLRLVLLAVGVGILGAAIGTLLRSTAAAVGALFAYLIVVEGILGSSIATLRPWLISTKIEAALKGDAVYWVQTCTTEATGTVCESVARSISLTDGALSLLALLVVGAGVALVTFRRRDVS